MITSGSCQGIIKRLLLDKVLEFSMSANEVSRWTGVDLEGVRLEFGGQDLRSSSPTELKSILLTLAYVGSLSIPSFRINLDSVVYDDS